MATNKNFLKLFSILAVLAMLLSNVQPPQVQAQGGDGLKRQVNAQNGRIHFIGPENGRALPASKALGLELGKRPKDPGMALAEKFGPEFGLKNTRRELAESKKNKDKNGKVTVKYQQKHEGVPVMAGELIVNTDEDGDLYSINGEISPHLSLSTLPTIDPETAQQTALQAMAKWYQKNAEDFVSSAPELWIYDESLLQPSTRPVELTWRMEVTAKDKSIPVRELVLVNAERGSISLHFNQVDTAWSTSKKADNAPTPTPQATETPLATTTPFAESTLLPVEEPSLTDQTPNLPVIEAQAENLSAVIWYVATTGNDTNSCLSQSLPCATINGALGKAASGDIIKVAIGTYTAAAPSQEVVSITKNIILSGGWSADFTVQNGKSTIDGQNARRAFVNNQYVTSSWEFFVFNNGIGNGIYNDGYLTITNSFIQNSLGSQGGGIYNNGNLTIIGSTIQKNSSSIWGGGIFNSDNGNLVVSISTIQDNIGGGIYNRGNLSITDSIVQRNLSQGGSGINNQDGNLTVNNTAIIKNKGGSGITSGGSSEQSIVSLNNTTVSANESSSSAGIYNGINSTLTLSNSTVSDNASGVYNNGAFILKNSILANNVANNSFSDCYGVLTSKGNNILSTTSGCTITASSGDKFNINPGLGTFLPSAGYHPLLPSSPAVNAGNPATCLPTDQRGMARVGTCDIGAYEYTAPGAAAKLVLVDGDGQRTAPISTFPKPLKAAVLDSQGSPVPNVNVTFTAPGSGASGTFPTTGTNILSVLTDPGGTASASFSANGQTGIYSVTASANGLTSVNFSLENAAFFVSPTGNDSNTCKSSLSPCATIGGAIGKVMDGDTIFVAVGTYPSVAINKSILLSGGWNPTFTNQTDYSTIDGQNNGAGISIRNLPSVGVNRFIVKRSTGGGISIYQSTVSLDYMMIFDNTGAGIGNQGGEITINHSWIYGNTASNGAGIYSNGNTTIRNSAIFLNTAIAQGGGGTAGGISFNGQSYSKSLKIENTTISKNTAESSVGAISASGSVLLNHVTITENFSQNGENILGSSGMFIQNSILANNITGTDTNCPGIQGPSVDGYSIVYKTKFSCNFSAGQPKDIDPKIGKFIPGVGYSPLSPGSPAINAGNPAACLATDQRGIARNGICDLGAYEYTVSGTAVSIMAVGGDKQRVFPATAFANPFIVAALDAQGSPVPNVSITFTAPASGASGTFASTGTNVETVLTDASGYATSSILTANSQNGIYNVVASSGAFSPVTFSIENGGLWYVSPSGNDNNSCNIPGSSCLTMNAAIGKAVSKDIIYVAAGTYSYGTGNGPVVYINKDITLLGGWNNTFTSRNGVSIIDGLKTNYGILVASPKSATVDSFTIQNGHGSDSGGIHVEGSLTLRNSTIHSNSAYGSYAGGGVSVDGVLITENVTIVNNSVISSPNTDYTAGGLMAWSGISHVSLHNTILANNTGSANPDCKGKIEFSDHSLIGNKSNECTVTQSLYDIYNVSPQLGALNQGYYPLLFGSPAIDAGNPVTCPARDQRGIVRPQGGGCDIGAYEYEFDRSASDMLITTYNGGNGTSLPGTFVCDQTNVNCTGGDPHAKAAHQYAIGTYNLYKNKYNRNSLDNAGLEINSTVHYGSGYGNAFWNGYMMIYGDKYAFPLADDSVAHELTHGVTQYESNLFYYYQSGAINESFSDLWGEYYDQTNGLGNDNANIRWRLGEDIGGWTNQAPEPALGLRDMSNPTLFKDPDKMTSAYYYTGIDDNGGVHWNSGVNNKAVYLMVDGGTFNNKTITALGWDKVGAIYYEANMNLLTSGSDYSDLYYALQQACTTLIGQKGIAAGDCAEVKDALDAVEMNAQPNTSYNPEAPLCTTAGTAPRIIFADDLENGTGNWTLQNGTYPRWQYDSPYGQYAQSGLHSLYADDYPAQVTDASAQLKKIDIPANAYLHFAQSYGFEYEIDQYLNQVNYDGGVLEYSTDDGVTWLDAGSFMDYNGYGGRISPYLDNPLGARYGFVGSSHGYISTRLNLSSLAGKSVSFRWRMGLDKNIAAVGWWLDNLKVYTCEFNLISGNAGAPGVMLSYIDGSIKTTTSAKDGSYSIPVSYNWSGTVTPTHQCYTFNPTSRPYSNVTTDKTAQDYTATPVLPCVSLITRASPNPTSPGSTVSFTVTFTKSVTGVDISDFALTTAGVKGASITNVTGSSTTYTVTVNTGVGRGSVRLDLVDDDSIKDGSNAPLGGVGTGNGNYTSGERYNIVNGADTVGVFRPSNGLIYLKNSNTTGYADVAINYGIGGDKPIAGDWDGDGVDTIGIYRGNVFYLRNSNTIGIADVYFAFGSPGDQPIAGDWDGDGIDTIGVYRSSNFTFYLRNSNTAGAPDMQFSLGIPGDIGIAGDWDGDGKDTTGVFRPSNGVIFLKNQNSTGYADIAINYGMGGDKPVTGDWNNDAVDSIGILRGNHFYLRNSNTVGYSDVDFALGIPGDMPIAGNWDGKP